MKFTLDGFSQQKAIEIGLDNTDLRLLRYFIDFKDSGIMATEIVNKEPFWWVKYEAVVESLPILNISKRAVMRRFQEMAKKGVLKSYTKKVGGTFSYYATGERYIELIDTTVCFKSDKGVLSNEQGVCFPKHTGVLSNEQQNINLLKDKSIKNIDIYSEVIDYLNHKVGSSYRSTTKTNRNLIKARLNEGFKIEDFKKVIDIKTKEWQGTQFEQYLRPQTLFSNKFEGYLNQGGFSNGNSRENKQDNRSSKNEPDFSKFS